MTKRAFKGFIGTYENIELVKRFLTSYGRKSEHGARNRAIVKGALLNEIPTEILAEKYGLSQRSVHTIVVKFLQTYGIERGVKPQSMGMHRRLGLDRGALYAEFDDKCAICGWGLPGFPGGSNVVHHIVEVADGGSNEQENLILLCPNCHKTVHAGLLDRDDVKAIRDGLKSIPMP